MPSLRRLTTALDKFCFDGGPDNLRHLDSFASGLKADALVEFFRHENGRARHCFGVAIVRASRRFAHIPSSAKRSGQDGPWWQMHPFIS